MSNRRHSKKLQADNETKDVNQVSIESLTPPTSREATPASELEHEYSKGTFERSNNFRINKDHTTLNRKEIAKLILNKRYIIIYKTSVYDLTEWAAHHPGGYLAIMHVVGRDATAQINAYHDDKIEGRMNQFKIASLEDIIWDSLVPPIQLGWDYKEVDHRGTSATIMATVPSLLLPDKVLPHAITEIDLEPEVNEDTSAKQMHEEDSAYHELHAQIRRRGLYNLKPRAYMDDIARYTFLTSICAASYVHEYWLISALALGLLWQQLVFAVHDAGESYY